jgi:hypothetical protein
LKFYMGMPIETEINIPQAAFGYPSSLFWNANTEIRTEFLLMKNKSNSWNFKTIRDCRVLPNAFTFCGIQIIGQGPNAWGAKPSDGVLDWFFFYRQFANPIFSGFETRSKVRQADIQLRTMKRI